MRPIKATSGLWVAFLLILLSLVPNMIGAFRITEWVGGAEIMQDNERFLEPPLPLVLHILFAGVYSIAGAFQFADGIRLRWPGWHRTAGKIVTVCGLLVGLTALWLTLLHSSPPGTGELLYVLRLLFGSAMIVSIYLGIAAIRQRNIPRHRAWMMRAYAIALGAGTQVFTQLVGFMIMGPPTERSTALQMFAGWVINLAVAEWVIRKRLTPNKDKLVMSNTVYKGGF